MPEWGH